MKKGVNDILTNEFLNLVEAHCYGIQKGSGHVLSNHVAVNG